jgi:hypothetical protein
MSISGLSAAPQADGTYALTVTANPNGPFNASNASPSVSAATFIFGGDPSAYGAAQNLSVSQDPSSGIVTATGSINPAGITTGSVFYQVSITWSDGSVDNPGDNVFPYTPAPANNGGTQDSTPTVSTPTATGVTISWNSSDMGTGYVSYNMDGDGTVMQESEDASAMSHSVTLSDLIGGEKYDFTYSTDFDDPTLPTVTSAQMNFTTSADTTPPDPPGRMGISALPLKIKVGSSSTITVRMLKRDGTPEAGVSVAFSLGAGQAEGSLSGAGGTTDAKGLCQVSFTASSVPKGRRKASRFVVAIASLNGKQKRHRAMVVVQA